MNKFNVKVEKSQENLDDFGTELIAEIWDDNESYLPDFTPEWLYEIIEDVIKTSGGWCHEEMESVFSVDEKFCKAIEKHPNCKTYKFVEK
jgi:hypothetical protein